MSPAEVDITVAIRLLTPAFGELLVASTLAKTLRPGSCIIPGIPSDVYDDIGVCHHHHRADGLPVVREVRPHVGQGNVIADRITGWGDVGGVHVMSSIAHGSNDMAAHLTAAAGHQDSHWDLRFGSDASDGYFRAIGVMGDPTLPVTFSPVPQNMKSQIPSLR
jgi:hypothetical protein